MIRRLLNNVIETTYLQGENVYYQNIFASTETKQFAWLTHFAPCFPIKSSNISILSDPHQFYDILLQLSRCAKTRITFASLYFGNGTLEKKLVENVSKNENFQNGSLEVNVLLDYTRGSRFSDNSRTTLLPLLDRNNKNCQISLYHTPVLRGVLKKIVPNKWNELFGLQHMKLYIFDDTLVISGANLSNDYFTNRQDRYFLIKDKKLCDFYNGLVSKIQMFSLVIDKKNNIHLNKNWDIWPYKGKKNNFIANAGNLVENYLARTMEQQNSHISEGNDTWIFPMIQLGQFGIEQDAQITEKLFRAAPKYSKLNIATGYFNLTEDYMNTLIHKSEAECNILMAHPKANGFLGAKGLAGEIPYAYCVIAQKFRRMCEKYQQQNRIRISEYLREGWTYHGKGLWYYPPNSKYPCLTLIGSPNFGQRSVKKDLETQLAIVTDNMELRKKMHTECENLYKFGLKMETFREGPTWVHGFVYLFKNYF